MAVAFFSKLPAKVIPMLVFDEKNPSLDAGERDGHREEITMDQCVFYERQNIEMSKNVQQLDEPPPPKQQ